MVSLKISLRTDNSFEAVRHFVDSKSYGGFCVREVAGVDNEHWHWYLEADVHNVQAFRVSLTRAVPALRGNASYSATVVQDVDKYVRYMCKGDAEGAGVEVVWRNSILYDEAKIEELHDEYWTENRRLKKRKAGSMIDWVVDECKRLEIDWNARSRIAEIYIRELSARGKPINLFSIRANINTVQVALCPSDAAIQQLCERCEQF